jgi:hypothetical protein
VGGGFNVLSLTTSPGTRRDEEYVASAVGFQGVQIPQGLAQSFDILTRQFGSRVYDSMMVDPTVSSCVEILKLGILSNGIMLTPKHSLKPGDETADPKADLSREITESCARMQGALSTPIENVLWQMLEALTHANKLAEIVYEQVPSGEDAGTIRPTRLKTKPGIAWRFVVNSAGEVLGIQATTVINGALQVYPVEKFFIFHPLASDGDPRGKSILRTVYDAWNFKLQIMPEMHAASQQFGSPSIVGETAPGYITEVLQEDENGQPIEGSTPLSPQASLSAAITKFIKNGGSLVVPNGTKITINNPNYDGKFFKVLLDWICREIAFGILKSTRLAIEAEHGSKADSGTQQDSTGLVIRFFRAELCRAYRRQVLWQYVALNWGEDAANDHTPDVSLGVTEHQDFATNAGAIAQLWTAGVIRESQRLWSCQMLGIDPGDPAKDAVAKTNSGEDVDANDGTATDHDEDENASDSGKQAKPAKKSKGTKDAKN